jgi:hypothetical protein
VRSYISVPELKMSTKLHYSETDWKAISAAPVAAGLLIRLSDASGPVGMTKEALAVARAIAQTASGDAPEIVKALTDHVRHGGGRPDLPTVPSGNRLQAKTALIDTLRTAVCAVQRKSPGEVEGYKTWLACVTAKVAHASKDDGFAAVGRTDVSPRDEEAISQLADILSAASSPISSSQKRPADAWRSGIGGSALTRWARRVPEPRSKTALDRRWTPAAVKTRPARSQDP